MIGYDNIRRTHVRGIAVRLPRTSRAVHFSVVAAALLIAIAVCTTPMGSGDYGQWLMVSRFYSGDDFPAYRDLTAAAPLVPALIAGGRILSGNAVEGLNLVRALLVAGLVVGFYCAALGLFRSKTAGIFAALLPLLATDRFTDLFAFGGLPQAAAMIFLLLGFAALARTLDGHGHERRWWAVASLSGGLAILSHAGSVVAIVPSLVVAGLIVVSAQRPFRWQAWLRTLTPAALIAAGPAAYWLLVLAPANRTYTNNPASLAYRGPERLFEPMVSSTPTLALMVIGALAIGAGVGVAVFRRRVNALCLVGAWAAISWGVLGVTAATGASTDYPRFAPLLLAPLIVAAAGGAALALQAVLASPRDARQRQQLAIALTAVIAVGVLVALPFQARSFALQANGYRLQDYSELKGVAAWIDTNLPEGNTVLVSSARDGKWIEGLTGEDAMFASPTRYSFREIEWMRSLAATSLIRSTTTVANDAWLGMYTGSAYGPREDIPRGLLLAMSHDGEFLDVLRFPEGETAVFANGQPLARLQNLDPVAAQRIETPGMAALRTSWQGQRGTETIGWTRGLFASPDGSEITLSDTVAIDGPSPIDAIEQRIAFTGLYQVVTAEVDGNSVILHFAQAGRREPIVRITVEEAGGTIAADDDGLTIRVPDSQTMTLRIASETSAELTPGAVLLYPHQTLADLNIGAAVLTQGPATAERVERLRALGLVVVRETDNYILMALDWIPTDSGSGGVAAP